MQLKLVYNSRIERNIIADPLHTVKDIVQAEFTFSYPMRRKLHYRCDGCASELIPHRSLIENNIADNTTIHITYNRVGCYNIYSNCGCAYHFFRVAHPGIFEANIALYLIQELFVKHPELKSPIGYHINNFMFPTSKQFFGYIGTMVKDFSSTYRTGEILCPSENCNAVLTLDRLRCSICNTRLSNTTTQNFPMKICCCQGVFCASCSQGLQNCPSCHSVTLAGADISSLQIITESERSVLEYAKVPQDLQLLSPVPSQLISNNGEYRVYNIDNLYEVHCATRLAMKKDFMFQAALLKPLARIPNILPVYGFLDVPTVGACFVTQYLPNGLSLRTALNNGLIQQMSWNERVSLAKGVIRGVAEIHLAELTHFNLRPESIILDNVHGQYIPKISGFQYAKFSSGYISRQEISALPFVREYKAPELITGISKSPVVDIYALGMVLYEILKGQSAVVPETQDPIQVFSRDTDWQILGGDRRMIPSTIRQVIEGCWSQQSTARPSIGTIREALEGTQTAKQMFIKEFTRHKMPQDVNLQNLRSIELFALYILLTRIDMNDVEAIQLLLNSYYREMGVDQYIVHV